MQVNVISTRGAAKGQLDLADGTFGKEYNEALIHQVVTAYLAGGRAGTRAQKTRSEVRGGGAKPFNQKGSGRARAGTIRSPLWRGGGIIFAAKPQDHSQKVNKKMYRVALQSILSELLRQGRLIVVDQFEVDQPGTKALNETLKSLDAQDALILVEPAGEALVLSARNLRKVSVVSADQVDPVSLVGHEKVIATASALKKLEERLA